MKNNKKIFLISYGVGGAEAINAIFPKIKDKYNSVQNIAITDFAQRKMKESIYIDVDKIFDYIRSEKPDVVINERSNGTQIQNSITELCRSLGIFNIALLDFYGAYKKRFTAMPDIIISPSTTVTNEMINEGFNKDKIITAGNPAFDRLEKYNYSKMRDILNPKIIFVSQYLQEAGSKITQYEIFTRFYNEIHELYKDVKIDVKIHPNENINTWIEFLKDFENIELIRLDVSEDLLEKITSYDLVVGYNSTVQLQSYLMNIPTIYYQLGDTESALSNFKQDVKLIQEIKYGDFEKNAINKVVKNIMSLIA